MADITEPTIVIKDSFGDSHTVPISQAVRLQSEGFTIVSPDTLKSEQIKQEVRNQPALASALYEGVNTVSLGGLDAFNRGLAEIGGKDSISDFAQMRQSMRSEHPIASTLGEVGGTLAPVGLFGKAAGLGIKAGGALAEKVGGTVAKKAVEYGTRGAVEGVALGLEHGVSHVAIADKPLSLEAISTEIVPSIIHDGLFGLGIGSVLGSASGYVERMKKLGASARETVEAQSSKLENLTKQRDVDQQVLRMQDELANRQPINPAQMKQEIGIIRVQASAAINSNPAAMEAVGLNAKVFEKEFEQLDGIMNKLKGGKPLSPADSFKLRNSLNEPINNLKNKMSTLFDAGPSAATTPELNQFGQALGKFKEKFGYLETKVSSKLDDEIAVLSKTPAEVPKPKSLLSGFGGYLAMSAGAHAMGGGPLGWGLAYLGKKVIGGAATGTSERLAAYGAKMKELAGDVISGSTQFTSSLNVLAHGEDKYDKYMDRVSKQADAVLSLRLPDNHPAIDGMRALEPAAADALKAKAQQALEYLQSKAPPKMELGINNFVRPDDAQLTQFADCYNATMFPVEAIRAGVKAGFLSEATMDALQVNAPETLKLISSLIVKSIDKITNMSYEKRYVLSQLLGSPVDGSVDPAFGELVAKMTQQPVKPNSPQANKTGGNTQSESLTPGQRAATRGTA